MSVPTFIPRPTSPGRCHLRVVALASGVLVIALAASAGYAVASSARSLSSRAPTLASVLRPLSPATRRYVLGITSLTPIQLWAAFGTSPMPPTPTSRPVALPILPACGPGNCWQATTTAGLRER